MRIAVLCVLVALIAPALAQAHRSGRVHNSRHIAVALYGPDVCGDTMAIPIMRGPMPEPTWVAYAQHYGGQPPYTGCLIVLADTLWTTEYLCRVLQHEVKHLTGWQAAEGQQYIAPDGTPDYSHSADPDDLMWPGSLGPFAPCANGAADPRLSSSSWRRRNSDTTTLRKGTT